MYKRYFEWKGMAYTNQKDLTQLDDFAQRFVQHVVRQGWLESSQEVATRSSGLGFEKQVRVGFGDAFRARRDESRRLAEAERLGRVLTCQINDAFSVAGLGQAEDVFRSSREGLMTHGLIGMVEQICQLKSQASANRRFVGNIMGH